MQNEPNAGQSNSDLREVPEHSLITFCIPTVRANRMPDTGLWFPLPDNLSWLHPKIRSFYKALPEEATADGKNMVFLNWGNVLENTPVVDTTPLVHAFELLKRWSGETGHQAEDAGHSSIPTIGLALHRSQSILSVGTPLLIQDNDVERGVSDAFDRCIDVVRSVEQAYVIVTRDIDYIPISVMSAYPFVPYFITDLDDTSAKVHGLFQTNFRPAYLTRVDANAISPEEFGGVMIRRERMVSGDPWSTHTLLYFGARRALEMTGDYIGCVTQAYTAGESLIDALMLSLFWERENDTINTIQLSSTALDSYLSYPRTAKWRSDNVLSKLLHYWYPGDSRHPILEWFDKYAKLRNRVVHLGTEPREADCLSILAQLDALIVHVGDVLAHDRNRFRYPKSSLLFLGEAGLRRRNAFSKRTQQIINDGTGEFWAVEFGSFSKQVVQRVWGQTT